jgi:hypothetical protein
MNCFAKCIFGIEHGKHVVGNIKISFITNIVQYILHLHQEKGAKAGRLESLTTL